MIELPGDYNIAKRIGSTDWMCIFNGGWTTTPPTRDGWYWAIGTDESGLYSPNDKPYPIIVYTSLDDGYVLIPGTDQDEVFASFSMWLGPLPEPIPPE
jgi:hypothetical protein